MKTRNIPNTDLYASVLCLGTAEFGSGLAESSANEIVDRYVEGGGNVLDTAEIYAAWLEGGSHKSEEFLGRWLSRHGTREGLIISTKGAHPRLESMHIPRMSKAEVQSDLDSSLARLGLDYVDIYWLHRDSPATPVEEILVMLQDFRKAGKIRYAGFSNWTVERAEAARLASERMGVPGFIGSQNQWSLAKADGTKGDPTWAYVDDALLDWHKRHGVAAFPYTSQANGYFRRLERGTIEQASQLVKDLFHHPLNELRYKKIKALEKETGLDQGAISLGYLLSQPFPVFPIIGPRKLSDLDESLKAANTVLTSQQVEALTADR
jgi:aryl-alcohol dehydrogenase-like predicted oxidoreductase